MRLTQAIEKFVMIKRGAGCKYALEARILKSFCTQVGDIELRDLTEKNCVSFTSCPDDTSLTQSRKYYILKSMFDWCVARKYLAKSPLFYIPPKEVKNFVPFIYSKEPISKRLAFFLLITRFLVRQAILDASNTTFFTKSRKEAILCA